MQRAFDLRAVAVGVVAAVAVLTFVPGPVGPWALVVGGAVTAALAPARRLWHAVTTGAALVAGAWAWWVVGGNLGRW